MRRQGHNRVETQDTKKDTSEGTRTQQRDLKSTVWSGPMRH